MIAPSANAATASVQLQHRTPSSSRSSAPAAAAAAAAAAAEPAAPSPPRWSLTSRILALNWRPSVPRSSSSRLWNPINSSPRGAATPTSPTADLTRTRSRLSEEAQPATDRDGYPLLTLEEQRRSKQSNPGSSPVVNRSTGGSTLSNKRRAAAAAAPSSSSSRAHPPPSPSTMSTAVARAAGVDDPRPAAPTPAPADLEAQPVDPRSHRPSASRASLPLSHRTSSSRGGGSGAPAGPGVPLGSGVPEPDDVPWGPSHPCFPHPNPHVPLSSPLAASTRVIRVKRDWMVAGDLAPAFANLYPEVLEGCMGEAAFRAVVAHVNGELVAAFDPWGARAVLDACLGLLTGWVWEDVGLTGAKARVRRLEEWIQRWNEREGAKEGVTIIPLRRTGYLTLDIQIPDPHIGLDTAASRPVTGAVDGLGVPTGPQQFGEFGPYPINHLPPPRQEGQQHLPRGVSVDGRSG